VTDHPPLRGPGQVLRDLTRSARAGQRLPELSELVLTDRISSSRAGGESIREQPGIETELQVV
jgi:hypothetical protein